VQRDQGNVAFFMSNTVPFSFTSAPSFGKGFGTLSDIEGTNPFGALGNLSFQAVDPHDPNQPQTYEWSFTISQNIGLKTVLETSYVGNVSRHLYRNVNENVIQPGAMWKPGTDICCANGDTTTADYVPYKPWAGINSSSHSDTANYNSLQVTARRNVSNGLTVLAAYTWSKTLGYTSTFQGTIDPFNSRRNYGLLPFDRAHLLNFSYIYQLPNEGAKHFNGNRAARGILDGWQYSGITHFSGGASLGIGTPSINCVSPGTECHDIGNFQGGNLTYYGTPDIALKAKINFNPQQGAGFTGVGTHWLNPASVSIPNIHQFGTFENPTFRAPGSNVWDMTMFKSFPVGEGKRLEFRIAAFDVFNHANLNAPPTSPIFNWVLPKGATDYNQGTPVLANGSVFGVITNKNGHREMEAAFKLYF